MGKTAAQTRRETQAETKARLLGMDARRPQGLQLNDPFVVIDDFSFWDSKTYTKLMWHLGDILKTLKVSSPKKKPSHEEQASSLARFRGANPEWEHPRDCRLRFFGAVDHSLETGSIRTIAFDAEPDPVVNDRPFQSPAFTLNPITISGTSTPYTFPNRPLYPFASSAPAVIWDWDWPTGKKAWRPVKYRRHVLYYYYRTPRLPNYRTHPYSAVVKDPAVTYRELRDYCLEDLGLRHSQFHVARRTKSGINDGFVVQFKNHVSAVQFKLTWNGHDDDTNS